MDVGVKLLYLIAETLEVSHSFGGGSGAKIKSI